MAKGDNVIRLYDVKPEMALDHLNRATGLDFEKMPQNLADLANGKIGTLTLPAEDIVGVPPILTDVVAMPG